MINNQLFHPLSLNPIKIQSISVYAVWRGNSKTFNFQSQTSETHDLP